MHLHTDMHTYVNTSTMQRQKSGMFTSGQITDNQRRRPTGRMAP